LINDFDLVVESYSIDDSSNVIASQQSTAQNLPIQQLGIEISTTATTNIRCRVSPLTSCPQAPPASIAFSNCNLLSSLSVTTKQKSDNTNHATSSKRSSHPYLYPNSKPRG
jgi:hypothetical protein